MQSLPQILSPLGGVARVIQPALHRPCPCRATSTSCPSHTSYQEFPSLCHASSCSRTPVTGSLCLPLRHRGRSLTSAIIPGIPVVSSLDCRCHIFLSAVWFRTGRSLEQRSGDPSGPSSRRQHKRETAELADSTEPGSMTLFILTLCALCALRGESRRD